MARNLREVIAAVSAGRRAKVAAAYRQRLIALKKKRQLEEAKRVMELDSNLIAIAVIIRTTDYRGLGLDAYRPRCARRNALVPAARRFWPRSFAPWPDVRRARLTITLTRLLARKLAVAGMPRPAEIGALSICIMAL
jgi:hypothetical protein